ncbi:hypothetical protein Gohar_005508 [Gossypium harknessii]|uniref:Uncharacterized protein n=1 Tax=Gossypium harknessii TaxID=34285 RepID=A0A7J9H862_9ROSI|nr:hypothetical protein [Gossypium harknessii]
MSLEEFLILRLSGKGPGMLNQMKL